MTGPEAKAAIATLARWHGWRGEGQREFARLTAVDLRRLVKWLADEHPFGGDALCLLLAMQRDTTLPGALRDAYRPGPLPISGTLDRLLWAMRRDLGLVEFLARRRR